MREELSEIIGFETSDPRLQTIDVVDAHVSPDGKHATVKVVVRGDERDCRKAIEALDGARHYLRHELAVRLSLRRVPELHFDHDKTPDIESRIDFLLKRAKKSRGRTEN